MRPQRSTAPQLLAPDAPDRSAATDGVVRDGRDSFRNILKATSLIGGASVLNILIGMVRTKCVAVLLGPTGVGLAGMYTQIATLAGALAGMGIANSGVRQVAEAHSTRDDERIARTVVTLRRAAWVTGALGLVVTAALALPISRLTFGDGAHAMPIALLGFTVLFGQISSGQRCVLQGTRRIADVARISVLGSVASTLLSIPCYCMWGTRGVIAALILSALAGLLVSWWYARAVPVRATAVTRAHSRSEVRALLRLGISFMGAGLLGSATTYAIQAVLVRQFGVSGLGLYQAAFSVSGALIGFVLGAMSTDFYPRLTAVAGDDGALHRMVNEQSQVAILLALPGLTAMLVFAPWVMRVFYARDFASAEPILRWCVLGLLGRVMAWPIGFVQLAKARGRAFLMTEALAAVVHVSAVLAFTHFWRLEGAGIAFAFLYVVYTGVMLMVMRELVGAGWTGATARMNAVALAVVVCLMINASINSVACARWAIGIVAVAITTAGCLRQLAHRAGWDISALAARAIGRGATSA